VSVLIVDDNPFNIMVAETLFSEMHDVAIQYESALNGQLALNKILERRRQGQRLYDIIFLDLNMPVMDGFEVRAT
jgi:CheY-like chemotaxis protein